jgi:HTH-type transcriptional regulator / antitoxin HipB
MEQETQSTHPIKTAPELGKAVRDHRKSKRLTQDTLASLSGVSTGFLSDFENGKPTAEIGKVLQVLHTLGLDLHVVPRGQGAASAKHDR